MREMDFLFSILFEVYICGVSCRLICKGEKGYVLCVFVLFVRVWFDLYEFF